MLSDISLYSNFLCVFFFFFQAEDGIRDVAVTGVQTCALPIFAYFGKSRCFLVVDRDGIGYEVALSKPGYQATLTDYEVEAKLYGHLRTESRAFSLVP